MNIKIVHEPYKHLSEISSFFMSWCLCVHIMNLLFKETYRGKKYNDSSDACSVVEDYQLGIPWYIVLGECSVGGSQKQTLHLWHQRELAGLQITCLIKTPETDAQC